MLIILVLIVCITIGLLYLLQLNEQKSAGSNPKTKLKNSSNTLVGQSIKQYLFNKSYEHRNTKIKKTVSCCLNQLLENSVDIALFNTIRHIYQIVFIYQTDSNYDSQVEQLSNTNQYLIYKTKNENTKLDIIRGLKPDVHFEFQSEHIQKVSQFSKKVLVIANLISKETSEAIKYMNIGDKVEILGKVESSLKRLEDLE